MLISFQLILANEFESKKSESKPELTKIMLTGTSTISVEPDTALLSVGILTDGNNCKVASENNSQISEHVLKLVKKSSSEE